MQVCYGGDRCVSCYIVQATGGSVSAEAFAKLLTALGFDESGAKRKADGAATPDSSKKAKTLMSFGFTKKES